MKKEGLKQPLCSNSVRLKLTPGLFATFSVSDKASFPSTSSSGRLEEVYGALGNQLKTVNPFLGI